MNRQVVKQASWLDEMETRSFKTFDGTRLTYYVFGDPSKPPMVIANGLGGNMKAWRHFVPFFSSMFRIYILDYRGLFQSDEAASIDAYSIPNHSRDLAELLNHEGLVNPVLVGWSMGVQVILEYFRENPGAASAFVALNGTYGNPFRTAFHSGILEKRFERVFHFIQKHWERIIWLRPHITKTALIHGFIRSIQLAKVAGKSIDKDAFYDMSCEWIHNNLEVYSEIFVQLGWHNAGDLLPNIHVPTLVIAGTQDSFIPAYVSKEMAQRLPNANYWEIPGATHFCPLEFPHAINVRVKQYLSRLGALEIKALAKAA